ncbi:MAG TPA: anhydro-N-acetylmuramic acid kinase [Bacteroidia bacterium]|nr:anhydro-N-acetylmuramic acid kinase [Bacteroidia bacterium]HNT79273.1 anhydro-N-acetylmuramic acid kinase [Bacteroidia bacterium]
MKSNLNALKVIGIMSGTSLDGLDIAFCKIVRAQKKYSYEIIEAETIPYTKSWEKKISKAHLLSAQDLCKLDFDFGLHIGSQVNLFCSKHNLKPNLIASHGHTVFHEPDKGFTLQIGSGSAISNSTGITSVVDFRSSDISLKGQGAPLVPIADRLLFSEYKACINLGGFSNISIQNKRQFLAFDICPINSLLNLIAQEKGLKYDKNGDLASKGKVDSKLLSKLNNIAYYKKRGAKSLSREWNEKFVYPLLQSNRSSVEDKLRTLCEHMTDQIKWVIEYYNIKGKILATGGGAYNKYLMNLLIKKSNVQFIIPAPKLVEFKEAMAFALLGFLRYENKVNILKEYTGAIKDSKGGAIYL